MKSSLLILLSLVALSAYLLISIKPIIVAGDNVTVEYTGWVDDFVFETSIVTFIVGNNEVIKGLDVAVLGMQAGDVKNITIPPVMGYGVYNPEIVYDVPIDFFNAYGEPIPELGTELTLNEAEGRVIMITNESVVIDTNHQLAGVEINMTVKVLSVK